MNIDEKIKQVLDQESKQIDELMLEEKGVFGMIGATFKGGNRFWLLLVYFFAILVSVLMFWTAYRFWIAEELRQMVFFGFCFLAAMQAQIALKMWGFMEMNRTSMVREIKRVELQLARTRDSHLTE